MWSYSELVAFAVTSIVALVGFAYVFFTWNFDYWRKRNVPHNTPTPFLGSLTFFLRKSPTDFFIDGFQQFQDHDYYGIWLFRKPALVINSPQLARKVLVKDFDCFNDRYLSSGRSDPLGALNIFTANDPLWSSMRRKLTPVFTSAKLRALLSMKNAYAVEVVDRIRRDHVLQDQPVDLRNILSCFTTDVIGTAAFGISGGSIRTNDSPLRSITRLISHYTWRRGIEFSSIFFFPFLVDFFGFKFFTNEMSAFFRRLFKKMVEERSNDPSSKKRDLLDSLIQIKKEAVMEGNEAFTDDVIAAQAAIFVQGGFDTTAVVLSYLFLELAHHPAEQQRLYEEIRDANAIVNGEVQYEIVKELPYFNMCIKETLRMYPAMGFLDRISTKEYRVDDKLTLPKGTPIYVNGVGMHYSDKYYPNPRKWDPERFSAENEKKMVPFTYLPFGEGPRNCIGVRFAQQVMGNLIVQVMTHFEFRPKPGQPTPKDLIFEPKGVFLGPDKIIDIQFVERKK